MGAQHIRGRWSRRSSRWTTIFCVHRDSHPAFTMWFHARLPPRAGRDVTAANIPVWKVAHCSMTLEVRSSPVGGKRRGLGGEVPDDFVPSADPRILDQSLPGWLWLLARRWGRGAKEQWSGRPNKRGHLAQILPCTSGGGARYWAHRAMRSTASLISSGWPAKENRTDWWPRVGSKSMPGVTATPSSSSQRAHSAWLSSVRCSTAA